MFYFTDRQTDTPGRIKMTREDGTVEYVTLQRADDPTVEGTLINSEALMRMQGADGCITRFITSDADGDYIEQKYSNGIIYTTFNDDGSITEEFGDGDDNLVATKTTTFSSGSITETITYEETSTETSTITAGSDDTVNEETTGEEATSE